MRAAVFPILVSKLDDWAGTFLASVFFRNANDKAGDEIQSVSITRATTQGLIMRFGFFTRLTAAAVTSCLLLLAIGCSKPANKPADKKAATPAAKDDAKKADMPPAAGPAKEPATEPAKEPAKTEEKSEEKAAPAAATPAADDKDSAKVTLGAPELTASIPGGGKLTMEQIDTWLADPKNHETLEFELPLGLDAGAQNIKGVQENPLTRAKIELGRQLYFDTRLCGDNTVSCASCHNPDEGFAAHTQFGIGVNGQQGGRNSPVAYNRILSDKQFWDGRAGSLEEQAKGPIANPIEMANTHEQACATVKDIPGYAGQFDKIFGGKDGESVTIDNVAKAIASFERALVTGPSPFDYNEKLRAYAAIDPDQLKEDDPDTYADYLKAKTLADAHPMSDSAKRGRELFFNDKGGCSACHVGANLTDELYHNLGVGMDKEKPDAGLHDQTKDEKHVGAFKTPTIRNVASSAPYMHDGSHKTLEETVEWYAKVGFPNPTLDPKIKKLDLSEQDKKDLVEFMKACTGDFPKVERGRLPQ